MNPRERRDRSMGEGAPLSEIPRYTSLVQLAPVGRIDGREVRFALHTSSITDLFSFLEKTRKKGELFIEGRICTPEQRARLGRNRVYDFLKSARVEVREIDGVERDTILSSPGEDGVPIRRAEAVQLLSVPSTPGMLAEEVGYETGFVPVEELQRNYERYALNGVMFYFVRGCNEFRLGSDTLSQAELDRIARNFGHYLWRGETQFARKHRNPARFEGFDFLPLDPSFIS